MVTDPVLFARCVPSGGYARRYWYRIIEVHHVAKAGRMIALPVCAQLSPKRMQCQVLGKKFALSWSNQWPSTDLTVSSLGVTAALQEIDQNKGTLYDPEPTSACRVIERGFELY
jgi:hypothetical protein